MYYLTKCIQVSIEIVQSRSLLEKGNRMDTVIQYGVILKKKKVLIWIFRLSILETIGRWSPSCDCECCQTPEDSGNVPVGGNRN